MNEQTTSAVTDQTLELIRPDSFDNARLTNETNEDYATRRIQMKKYARQQRFFKSEGEDNRAKRRERKPLRLTKKLHKVRNKWFVGQHDVTHAITHGIPLHQYLRVAELGFDVSKLTKLGKQIEAEQAVREEPADGNPIN